MNARVRTSRALSFRHASAACALLLAAACTNAAQPAPAIESTQPMTTSPIALTAADADRVVSLHPGQEFSITLQTIGGGDYGDPQISSPCVRFLGLAPASMQNPGGPRQVFQFQAVSAGEAHIVVPHSERPSPFSLTVSVK
jgi:hypothetical protein